MAISIVSKTPPAVDEGSLLGIAIGMGGDNLAALLHLVLAALRVLLKAGLLVLLTLIMIDL